jgi:hypothetical protein
MFSLKGLLQAVGITLLFTIITSFIIGLLNMQSLPVIIYFLFLFSNVVIGIIAPLKNKRTPYAAAFFGSVSLTVLNYSAAYYMFNVYVLADPVQINNNLLLSTSLSLLAALFVMKIVNRKLGKEYV